MPHRATRRRQWPHRLVAVLLVLGGGVLSAWPVAETFLNNGAGAQETVAYVRDVEQRQASDGESLQEALVRARQYNRDLPPSALWDPWGDEEERTSASHDAYLHQLADFDAMGRVRIPQIAVDLPILHDATKVPLSRGAGHMYGTSLPVGGADTHAVLAGHTGMKSRTMFDRLPELSVGQDFFVDVYGTTLTYRIDQIKVVEPDQLDSVKRIAGGDYVTLVTCYTPPGEHKQRMLVRGIRVPDAAPQAATPSTHAVAPAADLSIQDWMWPRIYAAGGAIVLVSVMALAWAVTDRRARRRESLPSRVIMTEREPAETTR